MSAPAIALPGSVQRDIETTEPLRQNIERLAYALWQERGSPYGSAEEDWIEAERRLRTGAEELLSSNR
jgi:hypothetical protein